MTKNLIVIPARLHSTRLARKLLLCETGKPLIQHTYESASRSKVADQLIVAVDSQEMADAVKSFDGQWMMTSENHPSGTDRVAEVNQKYQADFVVNVQGDEPDISAAAIDAVFKRLHESQDASVATLATPIRIAEKLRDPNCVKVVFDKHGRALYFSRSQIPFARYGIPKLTEQPTYFQHVGLYGYRRDFLNQVTQLPPTPAEQLESLEQLRFLHEGFQIFVDVIDEPAIGVDTPEDYQRFVASHRQIES